MPRSVQKRRKKNRNSLQPVFRSFFSRLSSSRRLSVLYTTFRIYRILFPLQRHDYQCRLFRSQGDVCAAAYSRYPPVSVSSIFKRRKKERQKKTCSPFLSRGDETSSCLLNISVCSVAGAIDKFEKEVARFVSPPFIRIAGNFFSF